MLALMYPVWFEMNKARSSIPPSFSFLGQLLTACGAVDYNRLRSMYNAPIINANMPAAVPADAARNGLREPYPGLIGRLGLYSDWSKRPHAVRNAARARALPTNGYQYQLW